MKTVRIEFSELRMHGIFTSNNMGLSSLYDRKFTPSYITSRDGITCPRKCCKSHGA